MTDLNLNPAPTKTALLGKVVRARGYARITAGPTITGTFHGRRAHLTLPVETIARTEIRLRAGGTTLAVTAFGSDTEALERALTLAASACGIDEGELVTKTETPAGTGGRGLTEAAILSVISAVAKAAEVDLNPERRNLIARTVLGRPPLGLAAGAPTIAAEDGTPLVVADSARHPIVFAHRITHAEPAAIDTGHDLPAPGPDTSGDALNAWLAKIYPQLNGEVAKLARRFTAAGTLIAGDEATLLMFPGGQPAARLHAAQRLASAFRDVMPAGWTANVTRTAGTASTLGSGRTPIGDLP